MIYCPTKQKSLSVHDNCRIHTSDGGDGDIKEKESGMCQVIPFIDFILVNCHHLHLMFQVEIL